MRECRAILQGSLTIERRQLTRRIVVHEQSRYLYLVAHNAVEKNNVMKKMTQDRDVELGKLAIWHSLQNADVDTNLVGIQNTKQLQMNLDVMLNGITEKEKALLQEIQEK